MFLFSYDQRSCTYHTNSGNINENVNAPEVVWVGDDSYQHDAIQQAYYKGHLKGEADSWVRLTLDNGNWSGMIRSNDTIYVVEPASQYNDNSGSIIYRLADSDTDMPGSCASEDESMHNSLSRFASHLAKKDNFQPLLDQIETAAVGKELSLGLIADFEFFQRHGNNSANILQNLLNQIDGIYEEELGVSLRVGKIAVFSNSNDPFSDTINPSSLLNELNRLNSSGSNPVAGFGLTHLFTGKNLEGNVIGIAFLGTICRTGGGVGLSSDLTRNNKSMVLLTAHEIGHNFNAPHDNQSGACASTPFGFIMNPFVSTQLSLDFSSCSKSRMSPTMNAARCLTTPAPEEPTEPTPPTPPEEPTPPAPPEEPTDPTPDPAPTPDPDDIIQKIIAQIIKFFQDFLANLFK